MVLGYDRPMSRSGVAVPSPLVSIPLVPLPATVPWEIKLGAGTGLAHGTHRLIIILGRRF